MKVMFSKGLPKILPFAVSGIAGAAVANVLVFVANKVIERNHAAIWRRSKADAEAFWDGFEDGMKDANRQQ